MRQTWTFPLRINSEPICTMFSVQRVSVHLSHLSHFFSINKYRWLPGFQMLLLAVLLSLPDSGAEKTDAVLSILYTLYSSKHFPTAVVLTRLCLPGFNSTVCLLLWSPCLEQATPFVLAEPPGHVCWFCLPTLQSSTDYTMGPLRRLNIISPAWHLYICHALGKNLEIDAFIPFVANKTVL